MYIIMKNCSASKQMFYKHVSVTSLLETYIPTKFHVDIWLPSLVMGVEREGEREEFCPITKHGSALYRDGQGLPIIDVLGYDGQNYSPPCSDLTPITQKGSHISTRNCGYVDFRNTKRLVILTCS